MNMNAQKFPMIYYPLDADREMRICLTVAEYDGVDSDPGLLTREPTFSEAMALGKHLADEALLALMTESQFTELREPPEAQATHPKTMAEVEKIWEKKWRIAVNMAALAQVERDNWKARHDHQVQLKRIIAARPDLKDRAPKVEKLMAERNRAQGRSTRQHEQIQQLEKTVQNLRACLEQLPKRDQSK